MNALIAAVVFLPILIAPLAYLSGRRFGAGRRDLLSAGVALFTLAGGVCLLLFGNGAALSLGGFCALGLSFRADGLRALLTALAGVIFSGSALLSLEYFRGAARVDRYQFFMLLTLGGTMGCFLADDFITLFIFFELVSFASWALVKQEETERALRAGQTYLAISVFGGLATLAGLFLLYNRLGSLSFDALFNAGDRSSLRAIGALVLTGFAAKAGLFPLHVWLPEAHPAAPAPASALLSCILTKTGVFGALVLSCRLFYGDEIWGLTLIVPAAITMLLGAVLALLSTDLKRTLACSSLSQIGFVLTGVGMMGLLGEESAIAAGGAILHLINHALIKLSLFGCAGVIVHACHKLDLNELKGFGRKRPLLLICFLLSALGIAGVPGFGGYVSKTLLHEGIAAYAGPYLPLTRTIEWVFLFSGGLTFAYMSKLFICLFVEKGEFEEAPGRGMSRLTGAVLLLSALAMPLFGLLPKETLEKLGAFAMPFMGHSALPGAAYYSAESLKGALISLCIGAAVYLGVVRTVLMKGGRYLNRLPEWLSLEKSVYRPFVCKLLPAALKLPAKCIGLFTEWFLSLLRKLIFNIWDRRKTPPTDEGFAVYPEEPYLLRGFTDTLAFSFLMLGLGLVAVLLYLLFS